MEFKVFSLALGVTLVAESIQVATNLSPLLVVSRQAALGGARGAASKIPPPPFDEKKSFFVRHVFLPSALTEHKAFFYY